MRATVAAKTPLGRPRGFSKEEILDCVLKLLDRDGVDAITFRGVARELGTVPGTLNNYFENLADLEDAVAARLLTEIPLIRADNSDSVRDQLVNFGLALIRLHSTHPYLRQIAGPTCVDIVSRRLLENRKALRSMGLSDRAASMSIDVAQGLAYSYGSELHRLRNGGPRVLEMYIESQMKSGYEVRGKTSAANFVPEKMEAAHRAQLSGVFEALISGFQTGK